MQGNRVDVSDNQMFTVYRRDHCLKKFSVIKFMHKNAVYRETKSYVFGFTT